MEFKEYIEFMDEFDDPTAAADLKAAFRAEPNADQVILECLKEQQYLRTVTWLAGEFSIQGSVPLLEKIEGEYKRSAIAALKKIKS